MNVKNEMIQRELSFYLDGHIGDVFQREARTIERD